MKELFHIHTYRCGHAENISDEVYVLKAIECGAERITFTDHAPFPGNPFGNRMQYEELPEYLSTLNALKEKYRNTLEVRIGLEVEYLPSFIEYYQDLRCSGNFDLLMLGQHMYEVSPGEYSFNYPELRTVEYEGCLRAVTEGIQTGLFDVVAHPDRAFRRVKEWNEECEEISKQIINAAEQYGVMLEQNYSSMKRKNNYWKEFWRLVPNKNSIMQGIDAHSVRELEDFCFANYYRHIL